jgi:hypothetical protein
LKKEKDSQSRTSIYTQNWRVKPATILGSVLLLALFFQSCEEPIEVSGDLIPGGDNTDLRFVELPLEMTQYAFDTSIVSSNTSEGADGRIYVGNYSDPEVGDVELSGNFKVVVGANSNRGDVESGATAIRARFYMNYNYFLGETFSTPQGFRISQLADTLKSGKKYSIYDRIASAQQISIDTSVVILPINPDTTFVSIDINFANSLLSALSNDNLTTAQLYDSLRGFKIETTGINKNIQGLNLSSGASFFELIYQNPLDTAVSRFTLNLSPSSFTEVNFQPGSLIPSDYSGKKSFELNDDSKVYFNNLLGITPRINFDVYRGFIDSVDFMLINKAEIVISNPEFEVRNTIKEQKTPPNFIVPYILNEDEVIDKVADDFRAIQSNFSSSGGLSDQSGANSPINLFYNDDDKVISGDISFFLQEIYQDPTFWNDDYTIVPTGKFIRRNPVPFDDVPRFNIGTFNNFLVNKSDIRLRIYYTTFR